MTTETLYKFIQNRPVVLTKKNNDSYQVESVNKNTNNGLYVFGKKNEHPNLRYAFILDSIYDYFQDADGNILAFINGSKEFTLSKGILN